MTQRDLRVVLPEEGREAGSGGVSDDIQQDPLHCSRFTRVPAGEYLVEFIEFWAMETYRRVTFVIELMIVGNPLGEPHLDLDGYRIRRYAPKPRPAKFPSLRGNYAKDFRQITELRPPSFLHRINPADIYSNCILKARIAEVGKDEDGDPVPDGARYCVVRKILERVEGVPPYLERRGRTV